MKISNLSETYTTPSTSTDNQGGGQAPTFGRDPHVLETTTSGAVATVAGPIGGVQRRKGKGSMFQGIKTSKKFANSIAVKEGIDACPVCGQTPCNCTHISESEGQLAEKITKKTSAGDVISDFVQSNDPSFKDDSKKQRIKRALGAYYAMHPEKSKRTDEASEDALYDKFAKKLKDLLDKPKDRAIANRPKPKDISQRHTYKNIIASDISEAREADYGPEYQSMVLRLKQLAKEGPRKVVYDPVKRVYKTVPVNPKTNDDYQKLKEDLRKWFKEKWVRFNPQGKIMGPCARGDDDEGKPKCLPQSKAQSLGKKGRASAAARKRREDPNPERTGKAINVNTKKKTNEEQVDELKCWPGYTRVQGVAAGAPGSCKKKTSEDITQAKCPHCNGPMFSEMIMNEKKDACYYKVKSRYKVWPSAYASGALVKCRNKGAKNWGNK